MGIRKEDYQKFNFFFMELSMRNKKGRELVASLFSGYEISTEFFSVPFLTFSWNHKTSDKKEYNFKNFGGNKRSILGKIKGIFYNFLKVISLMKCKITADTS